jgi:hypothetical protein
MKRIRLNIVVSTAVMVIGLISCSSERGTVTDLDAAVRGKMSAEIWNTLPPRVKHLQCLQYKVSLMWKRVGAVSGPAELLEYYPRWSDGLAKCAEQYKIDEKSAEQLQEAVATKMAQVLGEEASSYLALQRLYRSQPHEDWLDKWRSFAIVGIGSVSEVLPERP